MNLVERLLRKTIGERYSLVIRRHGDERGFTILNEINNKHFTVNEAKAQRLFDLNELQVECTNAGLKLWVLSDTKLYVSSKESATELISILYKLIYAGEVRKRGEANG